MSSDIYLIFIINILLCSYFQINSFEIAIYIHIYLYVIYTCGKCQRFFFQPKIDKMLKYSNSMKMRLPDSLLIRY